MASPSVSEANQQLSRADIKALERIVYLAENDARDEHERDPVEIIADVLVDRLLAWVDSAMWKLPPADPALPWREMIAAAQTN